MNFRENLRFLMESRGIQTKELSSMTGISENTIKSVDIYLGDYVYEADGAIQVGDPLNIN